MTDTNNHRIRKITPAGVVSTLAGGTGFGTAGEMRNPLCRCG